MTAAGTDADGTARSMLGQLIEATGAHQTFTELLPELCDVAYIDLRPALVHLGLRPSRHDRYAADLGLPEAITDPGLREIVTAAVEAPIPVLLGGHSLVAGSILLLNQWAWDEQDRADGLTPDPARRGRRD